MTGSLESFHDEQLMAPPAGPPVLLGVELTPIRIGLLIGILGVGMAGFLAFTQLRPLIEEVQALEREVAQKPASCRRCRARLPACRICPTRSRGLAGSSNSSALCLLLLRMPTLT